MKQTKTFCDICGKELTDTGFSLKLTLSRMGYSSRMDQDIKDICGSCTKKISEFVDTLKNER